MFSHDEVNVHLQNMYHVDFYNCSNYTLYICQVNELTVQV